MTDDTRKLGLVRHLQLVLRLGATAEGLAIDEIAAEMEVSRRTAQRMRSALDLVFPMETLRDGQTLRYRLQGHLPSAVLAPTTEELADLHLAIAAFRKRGEPDQADRLDTLRHRMLAALREKDRSRLAPDLELLAKARLPIVAPGPRTAVPRDVQDACHLAMLAGVILSFDYESAHGLRRHEVAPRGMLVGARSYLVAAGNNWGDPMLFRLDKMTGPVALNKPAWPDEAFNLEEFAARSFGVFQEDPQDVVLRFDSTAYDEASVFQFHPDQETRTLTDDRLEVRFRSGGFVELAWHLFRWSGAVEIVAPDVLKRTMREQLQRSAARL
jgi:predicted DNA-binding transcriptional regulator YafY